MILLSILFNFLFPSAILSISEDQFGEFDWTRTNIGYIEKIIYQNKSIFVTTAEDILASVNIRTGELDWRVLLPKESSVDQLVADKGSLYTLSSRNGLLQAWSTANGDLQWSQSLYSAKFPPLTPQSIQSLSLDSNVPITPLGLLFVLYHDCFFTISPLKGQIFTQFCPNLEIPSHLMTSTTTAMITDATPTDSTSASKKQFVLSQVIPHSQKVIYNQPHPILIGSLQSNGRKTKDFTLLISIQNRVVTLTDLTPLTSSSSSSVGAPRAGYSLTSFHSLHQSFYSSSFHAKEMTISLASASSTLPASASSSASVFTLNLSSTLGSGRRNGEEVKDKDFTIRTHHTLFGNSVMEICSRSSVTFAVDQICVFLGIQQETQKVGQGEGQGEGKGEVSWVATELQSCHGHLVYTTAEEDFSSSMKSGVMKNFICLSLPSAGTGVANVQLTVITPTAAGKYSVAHSTISPTPSSSLLSHLSLSHLSLSTYRSKTTSELHPKLLIQSSSGTLSLVQQGLGGATGTAGAWGVRWSREESLAHVRQGVILDNTAVLDHKGLTSVPNFQTRLKLQLEDVKSKLMNFHSSLHSIPSTTLALVHDMLPPPLAASLMPTYQPPKKEIDVNVDLFGFNKMSVQLTSRCVVDGSQLLQLNEFSDCISGFQIIALDLVTGATLWSFTPDVISSLPHSLFSDAKTFSFTANLLKIRLHARANHPAELGLVISIEGRGDEDGTATLSTPQSALLTFQFHGLTGKKIFNTCSVDTATSSTAGRAGGEETCPQDDSSSSLLRSPDRVILGAGHVQSIQFVDTHLFEKPLDQHKLHHEHTEHAYYQHSTQHYFLLHSSPPPSSSSSASPPPPRVSLFPPLRSSHVYLPPGASLYSHVVHRQRGHHEGLTSYQVNLEDFVVWLPEKSSSRAAPLYLYALQPVGQLVFSSDSDMELFEEHIVTVVYPQPYEPIHQMAKVLGDDSLLLKYLNPHMAIILTEKQIKGDQQPEPGQGQVQEQEINPPSGSTTTSSSSSDESQAMDEMYVTVVDVVSAQIIYRGSLLHASQPVTVSLLENTIAVSYWNTHAQRFELSSIHLYEGMIGKYGLGPTSSSMDATRSAFNAPPPIALQKSFILPRGVTAMHHTITERGITNKNLLVGLSTGQLLSLDTRAIDPRRPLGAPSPLEKEEGLMQYIPFLIWSPLQILTVNMTLPAIETIVSSSSHLESTSLVLSYGVDVFFTRATPSKGFDMLASDFNKPLLALIVGGMALVVLLLKNYNSKRILKKQWL